METNKVSALEKVAIMATGLAGTIALGSATVVMYAGLMRDAQLEEASYNVMATSLAIGTPFMLALAFYPIRNRNNK